MAYQHKDNTFTFFKNEKKTQDNHPDYTGNGVVFGKEVWVSAWLKTSPKGGKFMSCTIKPKDEAKAQLKAAGGLKAESNITPAVEQSFDEEDDQVPF